MAERSSASARRRPRRPAFLEQVTQIPLCEITDGESSGMATAPCEIGATAPLHCVDARSAKLATEPSQAASFAGWSEPTASALVGPVSDVVEAELSTPRPGNEESRGGSGSIMADADVVSRPSLSGESRTLPARAARFPNPGPDMSKGPLLPRVLGALACGLLVGTIGGTVAALVLG